MSNLPAWEQVRTCENHIAHRRPREGKRAARNHAIHKPTSHTRNLMSDRTAILMQRLEQGYRHDVGWLRELGEDFQFTLDSARRLGESEDTDDEWKQKLKTHWNQLDRLLQRLNVQLREVGNSLERDDREGLIAALDAWEVMLPTEGALEEALTGLRTHVDGAGPEVRRDWDAHERLIKNHMETFQATMQAIRTKLRLLIEFADVEVDPLVRRILSSIPKDSPAGV